MRDAPKVLAAILLAVSLSAAGAARADSGYIDPGSMEAQHCKGTVSGGYSGTITACGLTAEMVGDLVNYTFKFRVTFSSGVVREGGLYAMSRKLDEPGTGRLTHGMFELGTAADVGIPTRTGTDTCMMLYSEDAELTFGSWALEISRMHAPEDEAPGFVKYGWLDGTIRMDLPQTHGLAGDPCTGVTVEATFKRAH